jgi:hypothetical protein
MHDLLSDVPLLAIIADACLTPVLQSYRSNDHTYTAAMVNAHAFPSFIPFCYREYGPMYYRYDPRYGNLPCRL